MIGFVINLTYNLTNPFLMLIIELMQYITIYFKGPFADGLMRLLLYGSMYTRQSCSMT
jgi:hypothetical protein